MQSVGYDSCLCSYDNKLRGMGLDWFRNGRLVGWLVGLQDFLPVLGGEVGYI